MPRLRNQRDIADTVCEEQRNYSMLRMEIRYNNRTQAVATQGQGGVAWNLQKLTISIECH